MNHQELSVPSAPVLRIRIGAFVFLKISIFVPLSSLLLFSGVYAQSEGDTADTLGQLRHAHSYTLPEYIVSANRWQIRAQALPSSATVLTAADLRESNGSYLADVLQGVPGLFLKSYGGAGSVSTTSLRGMGAEHTLVLIDGQRYNNVRDGQVDFGTFLLQNVDRIEILRGGFSSVYGSDAIGGIVNIITHRPDGKQNANAELSAGSYGMNGANVSATFPLGSASFQLGARRETGNGDYAFDFNDGRTSSILRRKNSDYAVSHVQLLADVLINPDLSLSFSNSFDRSDRGSPGAVLSPSSYNQARLNDQGFLSQVVAEWSVEPALSARIAASLHSERRQYVDPLASGGPDNELTDYSDRTITVTPLVRYVLSSTTSINSGLEYSHSTMSGNQVSTAGRDEHSAFVSVDHIIDFPRELLHQINFYPSIRFDHFSDLRGSVNPKLGINIGLLRSMRMRLKSSVGRSFRAPSFDDLYWKSGGNPNLLPERSTSFDAGVSVAPEFLGKSEMEVNYFDIRTKDRILWTPEADGFWTPKNLREVRSSGVEFIGSTHLFEEHLVLRLSYSNADTRTTSAQGPNDLTVNKQLPYIPHEMAAISVSLRLGRFNASVQHTFTGYRFSTETNDPGFVLPSFNKTDLNVSVHCLESPFNADARFEVSNLFNTEYQIFPNFPMPLRTVAVKLLLSY